MVYELTPSGGKWKEKILYNFSGGADGAAASSGLIKGPSGEMYGTTSNGGTNYGGTVYALAKTNGAWTQSVPSDFPNFSGDGYYARAGVILDKKSGTLYGVTSGGGTDDWGAVYELVLP